MRPERFVLASWEAALEENGQSRTELQALKRETRYLREYNAYLNRLLSTTTTERDRLSKSLKVVRERNSFLEDEAERFRQIALGLFGPFGNLSAKIRGSLPFMLVRKMRVKKLGRKGLLEPSLKDVPTSAVKRASVGSLRDYLERSIFRSAIPQPAANLDSGLLNDGDLEIIETLRSKGEIGSVSALIFTDETMLDRLGAIIAELDLQVIPVKQILVSFAGSVTQAQREDAASSWRSRGDVVFADTENIAGDYLQPVDALLIAMASVSIRREAVAVFAIEMSSCKADLVYSDEVFESTDLGAGEAFFKPSYSPQLASTSDYMGSCALIAVEREQIGALAKAAIRDVWRAGGVRRYLTQKAVGKTVRHAPFVLFGETDPSGRQLARPEVIKAPPRSETASIIIPTRDRLDLLSACIKSILSVTDYARERYEIVIVDNGSVETETLKYLETGQRLKNFTVVRDVGPFNFSRLNNNGVKASQGDVVIFLNNDTIITQPDWLSRLVSAAMQEGIGSVGAKLLHEDGSVQHGGAVLGLHGGAAHVDVGLASDSPGYHGLALHDREVSAVTGACMAIRRAHFDAVGGFDENLAVTFNDTKLCIEMRKAGLRNLQLNSVQVTHLESKSRGCDDTSDKRAAALRDCRYIRSQEQAWFLNDVFYNPNLSLLKSYQLAQWPRWRKPWRKPIYRSAPRILMLSCVHQRGHGVPVVMRQQAQYFVDRGWIVYVGGPVTAADINYDDCIRVDLSTAVEAMDFALAHDIDIVMPHTPPFFSISRWVGPYPIVAAFDYGEPPPDLFPDAELRKAINSEKTFSLMLAHRLYGISESIKSESGFDSMTVVPLGNSHLSKWTAQSKDIRDHTRQVNGWRDKIVVLNVCRFHAAERFYKGVDFFISTADQTLRNRRSNDVEIVFVQCGKATAEDVDYVKGFGIEVRANVSDEELVNLYCAADIYANFSQWEGWNLGIGQALAYGLPVIASDIPAHRLNFQVPTASSPSEAAAHILSEARRISAATDADRVARIDTWDGHLRFLSEDLLALWRSS